MTPGRTPRPTCGSGRPDRRLRAVAFLGSAALAASSLIALQAPVFAAMGFAHVDDSTQIMYGGGIDPTRPPAFGTGDLDGLWTMYGSLECPVIPD